MLLYNDGTKDFCVFMSNEGNKCFCVLLYNEGTNDFCVFLSNERPIFFTQVIELNLRASRSFPFVSKTLGTDFIKIATRIMVDAPLDPESLIPLESDNEPTDFVGIKVSLSIPGGGTLI